MIRRRAWVAGRKESAPLNMPSSGWGTSIRGLGTLIAVVMRYPEVSSMQYNPESETLTLAFIVRRNLEPSVWSELDLAIREILVAYRSLTRTPLEMLELDAMTVESVTVIEVTRDAKTLSVEEVGMLIEMLRDRFEFDVAADPNDLLEEEMLVQEENIQAGLEALNKGSNGQLVALREDGRVVVFKT